MTTVTTCNFTFRSHPPLSRKPRLSIYTGDVLVTSSTVMLRTLKNGTAVLGNHSLRARIFTSVLALSTMQVTIRFSWVPSQFRGRKPWGWPGPSTPQSHYTFTNIRVFSGFETSPYGTTVSFSASLTTIPVGRQG
ncbi:hypothetical protein TNCV_4910141 [Trichonephila clavipes]|nr:hypothetical protein TNCV_4910141 [Trichonephila clavipes]